MIASIQGKITMTAAAYVVVNNHGIGYQIFVPDAMSYYEGDDVFLHTQLIVREDSLTLYGFPTVKRARDLRYTAQGQRYWPASGAGILSTMSIDSLRNAVQTERAELLTRVPGVGKKTAQKIVFELKDKLAAGLDSTPIVELSDINSDVMDALVALGYSIVEAQTAIQSLPRDAPDTVEDRVRLALQYFA